MVQYIKIVLTNKSNGAFAANAILAKNLGVAPGLNESFFLIVKNDSPVRGGGVMTNGFNVGCSSFSSNEGVVRVIGLLGDPIDSFDTVILQERQRTNSVLRDYRIGIIGDIVDDYGVFDVNIDDLFAVEIHREQEASGVLIKAAYTTTEIYSGFSGYHHNQRAHCFNTPISNDKPYRIGVELECYGRTLADKNTITSARTNWFQCESDSSLSESINGVSGLGIEIKTIPLRPCDATSVEFWSEPMQKLGQHAVSKNNRTTGLHVHISKEILGSTERERQNNLSKLCTFYTYYVEDDPTASEKNKTICGRAQGYAGSLANAKTELGEFSKMVGFNHVAENDAAWAKLADGVKSNVAGQRWDINIGHWNDYGTIEFRKGKGAISKTRLAAICAWWEQMCLYCKNTHPRDFRFEDFFNNVCREYPAVAYFFQRDEEL